VRNREMVLAVCRVAMFFGRRAHRREQYGLSCKQDRFRCDRAQAMTDGRLGLECQYAAQRSWRFYRVRNSGAMAQAMTDSLREGGYCGR